MTLASAVNSHHTAWIREGSARPVPERYAVDGERLVCFGDRALAGVTDGASVWVAVHEIAGGPTVASFAAVARTMAPEAVPAGALAELLDHVPLGRSSVEIAAALDAHRRRRILELVA